MHLRHRSTFTRAQLLADYGVDVCTARGARIHRHQCAHIARGPRTYVRACRRAIGGAPHWDASGHWTPVPGRLLQAGLAAGVGVADWLSGGRLIAVAGDAPPEPGVRTLAGWLRWWAATQPRPARVWSHRNAHPGWAESVYWHPDPRVHTAAAALPTWAWGELFLEGGEVNQFTLQQARAIGRALRRRSARGHSCSLELLAELGRVSPERQRAALHGAAYAEGWSRRKALAWAIFERESALAAGSRARRLAGLADWEDDSEAQLCAKLGYPQLDLEDAADVVRLGAADWVQRAGLPVPPSRAEDYARHGGPLAAWRLAAVYGLRVGAGVAEELWRRSAELDALPREAWPLLEALEPEDVRCGLKTAVGWVLLRGLRGRGRRRTPGPGHTTADDDLVARWWFCQWEREGEDALRNWHWLARCAVSTDLREACGDASPELAWPEAVAGALRRRLPELEAAEAAAEAAADPAADPARVLECRAVADSCGHASSPLLWREFQLASASWDLHTLTTRVVALWPEYEPLTVASLCSWGELLFPANPWPRLIASGDLELCETYRRAQRLLQLASEHREEYTLQELLLGPPPPDADWDTAARSLVPEAFLLGQQPDLALRIPVCALRQRLDSGWVSSDPFQAH